MELRQLEILRELGALGSVTAVAAALHVTPSAVSQQLSALQREFQAPLTQRRGRNLSLTNAGLALSRAGVDVIDAIAAARHAVEVFEAVPSGTVRLCGFHSAAQALFGPVITELRTLEDAPKLHLADEDVAQEGFPQLAARYDLVLAHRLAHSAPWPSDDLQVIPLVQEPLDVALPIGHPLARRAELAPADVAGERWVTSREGFSPDDLVGAIAAVTDRSIEVVHRVNDYGSVASVIASGDAIGMVPRYTVGSAHAGLVLRPLTGITASRRIDLLTRPENLHRQSVQTVIAALRFVMARLVEATELPPPRPE
ncbi:LysR family transcriptional regulator [Leucobacter rhizosphaerae]|uniref:LysR family transcriptional regulator n=1 Tax=Leucobacter rhizosphaerae TaxID=2932245 RepID=A0ABY4FUV1_9MICO|nr:LysR family transcriptional regulator [Leucobacter rhizosphaerae]UOQ60016.1 LysR family transcriptional regulator [Leucobacter rhizosphaerae]